MKINDAGLAIIKHFEGLRLHSYRCPADVWTIGYGATGDDIKEGMEWTLEQCEERLKQDLKRFEDGVTKLVTVQINENQFSALVSFAYNIGLGAFKKSTLLHFINKHNYSVAGEFAKWNKVGGIPMNGLTKRRAHEAALFQGSPQKI